MLSIEEPYPHKTAFLQMGFRPFFAAALGFGSISVAVWMLLFLNGWSLPDQQYPTILWHAHEMIFGYSIAVVAGFLLTAVRNWTNRQTLDKLPLLLLLLLWLFARLLPFTTFDYALLLAATADISFGFLLFFATLHPLILSRQWKQVGIASKLLLLVFCNLTFYFGLFGIVSDGGRIGIYAGFYLLLALVLTMIRRLIPFFIEKGIGEPFQAKNNRWIDISSLVLFLLFAIVDIAYPGNPMTAVLAFLQFLLHSLRLKFWYHKNIWIKPLLWILYVAYAWICIGFLLKSLSVWFGISPYLALHSFAYGGVGLISVGMMARVTLGHTGRNVFDPPRQLQSVFLLLSVGAVFRTLVPLLNTSLYTWWLVCSQILWTCALIIMLFIYLPMLIKARIDRRPG